FFSELSDRSWPTSLQRAMPDFDVITSLDGTAKEDIVAALVWKQPPAARHAKFASDPGSRRRRRPLSCAPHIAAQRAGRTPSRPGIGVSDDGVRSAALPLLTSPLAGNAAKSA